MDFLSDQVRVLPQLRVCANMLEMFCNIRQMVQDMWFPWANSLAKCENQMEVLALELYLACIGFMYVLTAVEPFLLGFFHFRLQRCIDDFAQLEEPQALGKKSPQVNFPIQPNCTSGDGDYGPSGEVSKPQYHDAMAITSFQCLVKMHI